MGRATIISGGLNGRYLIEMDYGMAVRDAKVAKLTAQLVELESRREFQQGQVDGFQGGLDSFGPEIDALINEYVVLSNAVPRNQAALEAKKKQIDAKTVQIIKQRVWLADAESKLAATQGQIVAATAEKTALLALAITEQRPAWCADFTEDAAGLVATLDVPGESALILVAPDGRAPTVDDGALTAREIQSPAQVYWNAAVLPGWQKFKPTYRWGTITALNVGTDRASVTLAPAVSSAQGLDVNQAEALENVPVVYMTCNAGAFEVGDRCIVKFEGQDWSAPKVVGFLDNPKPCDLGLHVLVNLEVEIEGDYTEPSFINNYQRFLTLVYRLDATDPMDATKAVLVYRGASDQWIDNTGTTGEIYMGTDVSHIYTAITAGYDAPYISGAFVMASKLMRYTITQESQHTFVYPGTGGYPDPYNMTGTAWATTTLTVDYDGLQGTMSQRTDETWLDGEIDTTATVGSAPNSWPYYMDSRTTEGAVTVKNIHVQASTAGESGYKEFKWAPLEDGTFAHDPAAGYLISLPPQASDYTYSEIGKREKGFNWVKYNNNLIDRKGEYIATANSDVVLGDMLSRGYYVGANTDGTFSVKRLSDDQRFGSRLVLADLPDINDAPEYAAAIAAAGEFHYEVPVQTSLQKYFAEDLVSTGLRVIFLNDISAQIDPLKEWAPRTDPE